MIYKLLVSAFKSFFPQRPNHTPNTRQISPEEIPPTPEELWEMSQLNNIETLKSAVKLISGKIQEDSDYSISFAAVNILHRDLELSKTLLSLIDLDSLAFEDHYVILKEIIKNRDPGHPGHGPDKKCIELLNHAITIGIKADAFLVVKNSVPENNEVEDLLDFDVKDVLGYVLKEVSRGKSYGETSYHLGADTDREMVKILLKAGQFPGLTNPKVISEIEFNLKDYIFDSRLAMEHRLPALKARVAASQLPSSSVSQPTGRLSLSDLFCCIPTR
jgi:hypothetical protein